MRWHTFTGNTVALQTCGIFLQNHFCDVQFLLVR